MVKHLRFVAAAAAIILVSTLPGRAGAQATAVIDFEGLARGTIVNTLSSGNGISGAALPGSITVLGLTPDTRVRPNAAIIFDSTCTSLPLGSADGCTGDDDDLKAPALGNTLIPAKYLTDGNGDGRVDDPNDADLMNMQFMFDLSGFGGGSFTVREATLLDAESVEPGPFVALFSGGPGGTLLATIPMPITGDNQYASFAINVAGVDFMRFVTQGSGAIDNIVIAEPFCGDGSVDDGEQCDDGNTDDGDCCENCMYAPAGQCCSDGDECTINSVCNGQGVCEVVGENIFPCPTADVVADAFVESSWPDMKFGFDDYLGAESDPANESLVKITVSGLGGRSVEKVDLLLTVAKDGNAGSNSAGQIRRTTCDWTEADVTWNTRPLVHGVILDSPPGSVSMGDTIAFDITDAIDDGDGMYCFVLQSPSNDQVRYVSLQGEKHQPAVEIDVDCPCGETPPAMCGNGIVETGEECDDGNNDGSDCCSPECTFEDAGTVCDQGDLCTVGVCNECGFCTDMAQVECEPANPPCDGGELCNPDTGLCEPQPDAAVSTACDNDDDLCTMDHCDGNGQCVFQEDVLCQAPSPPCEGGEVCNPATGMCEPGEDAPVSTTCETDDDLCTTEHCDGAGECVIQSVVECPNGQGECEAGQRCDPQTGMCEEMPDAPVSTPCEGDDNLCTKEHCDGSGQCVFLEDVVCQAANPPCEGGELCNPATGMCQEQPDGAVSSPCDNDDNLCTIDHCDGNGQCVRQDMVECQPANPPCDGGEVCDPESGTCMTMPDGAVSTSCDADGDLCTIDHCDGNGQCVNEGEVECQPANPPCEGGQVCDPQSGMCVNQPDGAASTPCEDTDGNTCTSAGCDGAGMCDQTHVMEPASTPCADTDDNTCTTAGCDGAGMCDQSHLMEPVSTSCEADGDLCTMDHCDGTGTCVLESEVECQPADLPCEGGALCDPQSGECVEQPDGAASTPCEDSDGNACTNAGCDGAGACDQNHMMAPVSTSCEADDTQCTIDHCDGNGQCVKLDDVVCQPAVPPCEGGQICDPQSGMCVNQPDGAASTPCQDVDGNACTTAGCDGAGMCDQAHVMVPVSTSCNTDQDACTIDHCDGNGQCVKIDDVACQPANLPCEGGQLCDSESGTCIDQPDGALSTPCETDTDLCTMQHCDGTGACIVQSVVECPDGEHECDSGQVCDPTTGLCKNAPPVPVSTPCENDDDLCTKEHCDGNGSCVFLEDVECREANPPCEGGEVCDSETGECVDLEPDAPVSTPCENDADTCTIDHCDGAGECVFLERDDDPLCDNHFKCYKQFMGPRVDEDVTLVDQFKTSIATVTRPERFCNPANKNDEGIDDPTAHMNCYRIKEDHFDNIDVIVTNQFGEQKLTVRRPESLCVPAIKDEIPSDLDINHYKCYGVRRARGQKRFEQREVTLEDQFEFKNTIVKRPKILCNPVGKNGEPIPSPESHLVCYSIKDARGQDRFDRTPVDIEDQFNSGSAKAVRGDCREVSFMCVPSLKRHADVTTTTTGTSSTTTTTVAASAATACGNGVIDVNLDETCETAADCSGSEVCERCQCVGTGDVRITLSWYGRNDLDLHVTDPAGEEIYYQNPAADSGGMLEANVTPSCDGPDRMNVENVYWPAGTAPPGRYRVQVNYFGLCADDVQMPAFTVTSVVDGVETEHESKAIFPDSRCGPCMPLSSCLCHPVVQLTR